MFENAFDILHLLIVPFFTDVPLLGMERGGRRGMTLPENLTYTNMVVHWSTPKAVTEHLLTLGREGEGLSLERGSLVYHSVSG